MIILSSIAALIFTAVVSAFVGVQVGLWLASAPVCTCGKTDCGGGCLGEVM